MVRLFRYEPLLFFCLANFSKKLRKSTQYGSSHSESEDTELAVSHNPCATLTPTRHTSMGFAFGWLARGSDSVATPGYGCGTVVCVLSPHSKQCVCSNCSTAGFHNASRGCLTQRLLPRIIRYGWSSLAKPMAVRRRSKLKT